MKFFYLSFCDPTLPEGQRFIGATMVKATDERDAVSKTHRLGINPGGEIALIELDLWAFNDIPLEARYLVNRLATRDEVMSKPHFTMADI